MTQLTKQDKINIIKGVLSGKSDIDTLMKRHGVKSHNVFYEHNGTWIDGKTQQQYTKEEFDQLPKPDCMHIIHFENYSNHLGNQIYR